MRTVASRRPGTKRSASAQTVSTTRSSGSSISSGEIHGDANTLASPRPSGARPSAFRWSRITPVQIRLSLSGTDIA